MDEFSLQVQMRWSDLDPNFHLRHSVYYDWGAMCRVNFFEKFGLTIDLMQQQHFGPIILREECIFRKEIKSGDAVRINLTILKSKKDYSRWALHHTIFKNETVTAAIITLEGAWLDTVKRKLTVPPAEGIKVFSQFPRDKNFEWID